MSTSSTSSSAASPASLDPSADATARLGMWVFLASELLLFGGLLLAYGEGRAHWPRGFAVASRHTDVLLGTINTALLLTSSALVAAAASCGGDRSARRTCGHLLAAAAALGVAFLAIKGVEYHDEWREGLVPGPGFALAAETGASMFFTLYFLATALHALHLAVGVVVLAALAHDARASAHADADVPDDALHAIVVMDARRIEVAGLYWHFVDIVWIFLYPLIYLVERHA